MSNEYVISYGKTMCVRREIQDKYTDDEKKKKGKKDAFSGALPAV